ncbi:unnamed protein product [Spirodela intermedia]|uniref:Uncharacterized protein n=1 Tax=Spirodela intermedia TaxID=51605 RepID=A0A7I8LH84_SPIIN|nr:unnamed protein product [Spirodela intermedia]
MMLTMPRMDSRKNETQFTRRSPLSPSTKNSAPTAARKPPPTRVSSIALASPPPSAPVALRRCSSPNCRAALSQKPSLPKRSQSTERRRPTTPSSQTSSPASSSRLSSGSSTPVEDAMAGVHLSSRNLGTGRTPDGPWPAMRSLSGSFQLECVSAEKPVSGSNAGRAYSLKASSDATTERKRAPSKGKNSSDGSENYRPVENSHPRMKEQHQWPGIVNGRFSARASSRRVDLTVPASSRGVSPARRPSTPETPRKELQVAINGGARRRTSLDGSGKLGREILRNAQSLCERTPSLTRLTRACSLPRPGSPHPPSPRKAPLPSTTSSRSFSSPCPMRPSSPLPLSNTSVMSRSLDGSRGRKSSSRIDDEFKLRMLYNRYLQWHFVNTHADAAMLVQKITAESILYSVWVATSGMRDSILMKRINVQRLRIELALGSILDHQMPRLEDWESLEREHSCSLSGAADALRVTMLGLPVVGGAKADLGALKGAISSALDVIQTMSSSVYHLLSRLEGVNSVVSELTELATEERAMLDECMALLASTAALQVQECSLRAHLLQLRRDR